VVTALGASLLVAAVTVPAPSLASSSDQHTLTHRKSQLSHSIASSNANVDEISRRLLRAQHRLDSAAADLSKARANLAGLQSQVQVATVRDQQMQKALDAAELRLHNAKAALALGRRTVAQQRATLAANAVSSAQARLGSLTTLSLLLGARSTQSAISQVQVSDSALNKQLDDLQRYQANQVLLTYTEREIRAATRQVAADRKAAAATLATKQRLESAAADAAAAVADQVSNLRDRRNSLAGAKRAELRKIHEMQREQAQVEAKLRRIAAAEARAAARRAAARRAAAQHAAITAGPVGAMPSDGGYLSYPVRNSYITSPYGMRLNPVVHVYELHDGTDFHALCGTPVYAAASGRVSSEYWSDVYGHRLFIDHGMVRGVNLQTSYNHLTSYVAHVGEQVSRGQLVAYSGTTGWSTGCHLHFSVYVNGATVNPVTWL
jgi:murein DD-endopeptidase MepM/ murein hydrolase activator NlpD